MSNKVMTILEQAMAYHVHGYNLIPIKKDKKPALGKGEIVPQRTADQTDEQIIKWFSNPSINIGIITGKKSGIIVIDVDTYKGAKDIFPDTFTVQTGNGGLQKYYQYTEGFTISASGYPNMPFVDLRADGGYVVAPPSITDFIDRDTGKRVGGEYKVINDAPLAPFPSHLFPQKKVKKTITEMTTAKSGSRNTTLASFAGKLLQAENNEENWYTEILPAVERANLSYTPPLSTDEVRSVFDSIAKKEKERRASFIVSPFQQADGEDIPATKISLRRNGANVPYKDMGNAMIVLSEHPYYKDTIKFNTFQQEIEYNGNPLEDQDINKIQHFMQVHAGLPSIGKEAVYSAIVHYAYQNKYDEAQDWLKSLIWDGTPRLSTWLPTATGVPNDGYHRGIGTQWLMGMVNRIMIPGCIWDYMLVLVGKQGIGKSSLFRIIGGKWYKSFTGSVENKDFYLTLRGAVIVDLDEGATLYKAESIKIKSIITQTHDEFRAPYDRVVKKYPRRFVFSMSTNDSEPFRDVTGNRRYWVLDMPDRMVDFKWLEDNRDQLFAEAYHYFKNKIEIDEVPWEEAKQKQDEHLPTDAWTERVMEIVQKSVDYCSGSKDYFITIQDIYLQMFPDESLIRLDRKQEIRIGQILLQDAGLEKRRIMDGGQRKNRYYLTEKKSKQLQEENAPKSPSVDDF